MVIVHRGPGRFAGRLPDGLGGLTAHNLITFESHHEALDAWTVKELVAHYVAYRKLVSLSPSRLLPEERFGLFAICARRPEKVMGQVPWRERRAGVYDLPWGTDTVRVVVAGELRRQPHNAPLHLFSASPHLVGFGGRAYRRRSERTSRLLGDLFGQFRGEGLAVAYTMKDFDRDYIKRHLPELPREEREDVLRALAPEERLAGLAPEERLAGLSIEEIRRYLQRATAGRKVPSRKPGRKNQP